MQTWAVFVAHHKVGMAIYGAAWTGIFIDATLRTFRAYEKAPLGGEWGHSRARLQRLAITRRPDWARRCG